MSASDKANFLNDVVMQLDINFRFAMICYYGNATYSATDTDSVTAHAKTFSWYDCINSECRLSKIAYHLQADFLKK